MNPKFDHDLYSQSHVPSVAVIQFLAETLPSLGWSEKCHEVILDVGCGDGAISKVFILPLFKSPKKMVAFDALPKMIDVAKVQNFHPQIEYTIADIGDWSTLQCWKSQITKLISIHCFHWLKDQRLAFQNTYQLLNTSGEAAFVFFLEATFFTANLKMEKNPKWSQFFNKVDNHVPDSHHMKYDASYYQELLKDVGFEIIHCKEKQVKDVLPSDADYINFFASVCVLVPHVPTDRKEEFRRDLFQEILKHNGRDSKGFPFHQGKIIELVVRKK